MKKAESITQRRRTIKQKTFLAHLRKEGFITSSARQTGISRQLVYYWRDNSPHFEKQMRDAENEALKNIPATACQGVQRKTRKGIEQNQAITVTATRYIERRRS